MATYKAEFLAHYYDRRLRPRDAYAMGMIYWWSRLASVAPRVVNSVTGLPGLSTLSKMLAGIDRRRSIPRFAPKTFRARVQDRQAVETGSGDVILWPDTFNNNFFPDTLTAAHEVLDALGFRVHVPERSFCCGRPLYDFGMLRLARRQLKQILVVMSRRIAAGIPIIVLEPSCASVFRDEMLQLFPDNQDAVRLSRQVFLLDEFIEQFSPDYSWPRLSRQALVHLHCHRQSVLKGVETDTVLGRAGIDAEILHEGCCGMAGAFGFTCGHYDVSTQVGERALLPRVRASAPETLVIADGFSCREQIAQLTDRRPLHTAEALWMALQNGSSTASVG
ncbi:MAG TPA: heterodisulfide reductase-related iron-sulfur binding cluster, partial [Chloroflexota bacterium]|nr:heterodisulfide reductase-related iron-sulfur binding cluster [Chloroflexota bacterium]